jgi:SAM-dependent methyltransferase
MMRDLGEFFGRTDELDPAWRFSPPLLEFDLANQSDEVCAQREACIAAGGTGQAQRSLDASQSGYYDLPHYERAIDELLGHLPGSPLLVELGCGSGRIVRLLLDACAGRIGALDFNDLDLHALWTGLPAGAQARVLPMRATLTAPPPLASCADAVLMIEATTGLAQRDAAFRAAAQWLKPGGYLLLSEPSATGYFVHALLNRDWGNVRNLCEGTFDQAFGTGSVRMYFTDADALDPIAMAHGFRTVSRRTVPAEFALLLHALKAADALEEQRDLLGMLAAENLRIPRLELLLYRWQP